MISVLQTPVIEPDPERGWDLVFYMGDACDLSIPFRQSLSEIASRVGGSLELPARVDDEDFVDGRLGFGAEQVGVYFEYCLGYLSLSHHRRDLLTEVLKQVEPALKVQV